MPAIQTMRGPTNAMTHAQRRVDECCAAVAEAATPERLAALTEAVRHRNDVREMKNAARLVADMMQGAMVPECDPLPPGFVDNDHDGHG